MRLEEIIARGVYAAVLTPFNNELEPEPTLFVEHCQWLLANGCDGLAPFGTTGEGVSLTLDQKLLLLNAASEAGLPMNRIIAGTGTCALEDAVQFSIAATELGCEGVLCLPPFYYKEPEEEGLYAFYSELIQRVNNDALRLFLYHFPKMSSVSIDGSLINRLLTEFPNAVAGLKDSSGDWENTQMLIESFPDFTVFSGSEEFLLDNLEAGGAGCICIKVCHILVFSLVVINFTANIGFLQRFGHRVGIPGLVINKDHQFGQVQTQSFE